MFYGIRSCVGANTRAVRVSQRHWVQIRVPSIHDVGVYLHREPQDTRDHQRSCVEPQPRKVHGDLQHQTTRSAHVAAILLVPPSTQRYFMGAVAEGVSGELRYQVQSGVYRGLDGPRRRNSRVSRRWVDTGC